MSKLYEYLFTEGQCEVQVQEYISLASIFMWFKLQFGSFSRELAYQYFNISSKRNRNVEMYGQLSYNSVTDAPRFSVH